MSRFSLVMNVLTRCVGCHRRIMYALAAGEPVPVTCSECLKARGEYPATEYSDGVPMPDYLNSALARMEF